MYQIRFILILLLFHFGLSAYEVRFDGDIPPRILTDLQKCSQLYNLRESPPLTPAGLKHRAEADLEQLIRVLHGQGYYNAHIDFYYNFDVNPPVVFVVINTGPVYPLKSFNIIAAENSTPFPYSTIALDEIGVVLGAPATPKTILDAEEALIELMEQMGYPYVTIPKHNVIADQAEKVIHATLIVDSGQQCYFGPTTVIGNSSVREQFFMQKLSWREGKLFDPSKIEKMQETLEATGLFSSIAISHPEEASADSHLPITIQVEESKHRSIGGGVAYITQWGPGVTLEWQHRNIGGVGERLRIDTELWERLQEAHLVYVKPDFLRRGQDFIGTGEVSHETTKGYTETSASVSGLLERRIHDHTRFSYGIMYKILRDSHSDTDGQYNLVKFPLYLRSSKVNNLLDPTEGSTLNLRVIPSIQVFHPQFAYSINTLTLITYYPLTADHDYVFAAKGTWGSIFGSSRRTIPASERFYDGSETSMRGYRYQTVSPLEDNKPIGGRSLTSYSLELRAKATKSIGWVLFYDFGNVYREVMPQFDKKLLHSIGFGIRYHTVVGPLRLDIAVPLNRRPNLDNRFQLYFSIGQAF